MAGVTGANHFLPGPLADRQAASDLPRYTAPICFACEKTESNSPNTFPFLLPFAVSESPFGRLCVCSTCYLHAEHPELSDYNASRLLRAHVRRRNVNPISRIRAMAVR